MAVNTRPCFEGVAMTLRPLGITASGISLFLAAGREGLHDGDGHDRHRPLRPLPLAPSAVGQRHARFAADSAERQAMGWLLSAPNLLTASEAMGSASFAIWNATSLNLRTAPWSFLTEPLPPL